MKLANELNVKLDEKDVHRLTALKLKNLNLDPEQSLLTLSATKIKINLCTKSLS